jgi:NAD(P)H-dependent flavin oxidoreductase YrpB (nitropropane dioxygenase family)
VAALALGADGVYIGTRFIASDECDAHPKVKEAVIQGRDVCTVALEKWIVTGRSLKNSFTQKYEERQKAGASAEELIQMLNEHSMYRGLVQGDTDQGEVPCGQNAGIIKQQLSAGALIETIMNDIPSVFEGMKGKTAG